DAPGNGGEDGGGGGGLLAPVPWRPDRSPSPSLDGGSLEGFQAAAGGHQAAFPTRRPGGRSPSPSSGLKRRASFPASVRSWNLIDHRGGGRAGRNSRSRSPGSPSSVGGRALDDAHDQQAARSGGNGALTRRSSTPPSARPGFSGAGGATSE
ncbi:unnamed protein product, partial [Ectocarpus sp. 12 AP-2014]